MRVEVRPAHRSDADAVAVFLNRHMDERIPVERWRRLFHFPWPLPQDAPDYGRIALCGGDVVGFISRIYSQRIIAGRRELIANLSSWYLRKDHRRGSLGLRLYRELLTDRGQASYTVLSIAKRTYPLYDRWGFGILDEHRWLWRRGPASAGRLEIVTDPRTIEREAASEQRVMLRHHREGDLWPALVRTAEGDCLIVLTTHRKRDDSALFDVLYLSRPDIFERHATDVANRLLPDDRTTLAVDSRFVSGAPPGGERIPIDVPRRYLSDRVSPASLDMLYSEFVLLHLKPS